MKSFLILNGDKMTDFKDCDYRYIENDKLVCDNMNGELCDNCKQNIHLNCINYNPKKDMCLKWFEEGVSRLTECKEKTTFDDKELSRKWSN